MSAVTGFRWRVRIERPSAEAAFAALDEAVDALAGQEEGPAIALDLVLPEEDRMADAAAAELAVTMTGASLNLQQVTELVTQLFTCLGAELPPGVLPRTCPAPEPLPERDWVRLSQAGLPAQLVGRFRILMDESHASFWPGRPALRLIASTAFGTGHHATTRGMLVMLDALARRLGRRAPTPMLDVGCGSGVLALAMTRLWKRPVWASDIDPDIMPVLAAHARRNGVALRPSARRGRGEAMACRIAPGLDDPCLRRAGPFRLIVANILAGPLKTLAPALARQLAPDGWLLLSGILADEAGSVINRYRRFGLVPVARWCRQGWVTLAFRRPARAYRPLPPAGLLRQRAADPDGRQAQRAGRP